MRKTIVLSVFVASMAATPVYAQKSVVCSLNGHHGSDPDRVANDVELVTAAVRETYPHLPKHLQETVDQLMFVVVHNPVVIGGRVTALTKMVWGWSAEDDLEYRYPDREFAPEGTIKVNLTEMFVQLVRFCGSELVQSGIERQGCWEFVRETMAHEVLHAHQYHVAPVCDFASVPNSCPDGLCSPELIASVKDKVAYERQAWVFGLSLRTPQGMAAYGEALGRAQKARPDLFREGGSHRLIRDLGFRGDFEAARTEIASRDFPAWLKEFYEGQYRLPELAWSAYRLAQDLAIGKVGRVEGLLMLATIESDWLSASSEALRNSLSQLYPYIRSVVARYEREKATVESQLK